MTTTSRERLVRLVRRADADLAEAALLCCAEVDPDLDVDLALLRLDALADGLRTRGFQVGDPEQAARRIAEYLAVEQGFTGDTDTYHHPDNALLTRVLDRKRGLPITCSILYVAIARRLDVRAYLVNLPGHVVAAVPGPDRPILIDPFHDGQVLDERAVAQRITELSAGQATFHRAMLRPTHAVDVVRRLLNNLTRDFQATGDAMNALWSVELKLLLPNRTPEDHRILGELLEQVGRFDEAAVAFEDYLEATDGEAHDDTEIRHAAIRAKARLN